MYVVHHGPAFVVSMVSPRRAYDSRMVRMLLLVLVACSGKRSEPAPRSSPVAIAPSLAPSPAHSSAPAPSVASPTQVMGYPDFDPPTTWTRVKAPPMTKQEPH